MVIFKKLVLFYFTGTGNALAAANWIKNYTLSINIESQIINIADNPNLNEISIDENTLIVFATLPMDSMLHQL